MKVPICLLSLLVGIRVFAADLGEMRAFNGSTYERLWVKAGSNAHANDNWTYKGLKERLQPWEYNVLIASMFEGVVENGGWLHGMSCTFDSSAGENDRVTPDEMIAAWKDIGSRNMACAIEAGVAALKRTKLGTFDEASGSDYELIKSAISKAYKAHKEEDLEIQLYKYIQMKSKTGQSGAAKSAAPSKGEAPMQVHPPSPPADRERR